MKKMNEKELEQFIHATLRSLPDRKAPGTLEARVLAALEHQAIIPWWHKGWAYWPAAVRAGFLALATAVSGGMLVATFAMFAGVDTAAIAAEAANRFAGVLQIFAVVGWLIDFSKSVLSTIPPLWLYGGVALLAGLYASLFGLGAFAYRTLFRPN